MPPNNKHDVLIIGLGNPGREYEQTRHNLGIRLLQQWARGSWLNETEWPARVCHVMHGRQAITAFFPTPFMNESGSAVANYLNYHPYEPSQLIIVHDDLEVPFGQTQWQAAGSAHGHKGVGSIQTALQTQAIARFRLGIGRPPTDVLVDAFVLQRFSSAEEAHLPAALAHAQHELDHYLDHMSSSS